MTVTILSKEAIRMMVAKLKRSNGITMLEMMIAAVIVGILAAMAVPSLDGAIKEIKFKNSGREIISALRLARSSAITLQQPYGVFFDEQGNRVIVFEDRANLASETYEPQSDSLVRVDSLPGPSDPYEAGMMYAAFPNQTLIFSPDGSASATGDIYLHQYEDGGAYHSLSIWVTAGTGNAKMEVYDY
jgi:type II secretion system protein H